MQPPQGSDAARSFFWAMMFGLPAAFVGCGIVMIVAGKASDPRLPWAGAWLVAAGAVGLLAVWRLRSGRRPY